MNGRSRAPRAVQGFVKRLLDIVGSLVGLIVTSPAIAAIALAVKLDSPGPAFFAQTRVGLNRRRFTLLKFRTMRTDGDESLHKEYMSELVRGDAGSRLNKEGDVVYLLDDPRVTSMGAFLRRTSLDELPNLVNVLRGEMSLVGPRPPIPYEVEMYDQRSLGRLAVKPGLTGLAQVRGRGSLTFKEIVELDLEYIESRSLLLDLRILFETIPTVLGRRGV